MSSTDREEMAQDNDENDVCLQQSSAIDINKNVSEKEEERQFNKYSSKGNSQNNEKINVCLLCGIAIVFFILGFELSRFISVKNDEKTDNSIAKEQASLVSKVSKEEENSIVKIDHYLIKDTQEDALSKQLLPLQPQQNITIEKTQQRKNQIQVFLDQKTAIAIITKNPNNTTIQQRNKQENNQTNQAINQKQNPNQNDQQLTKQVNILQIPPQKNQAISQAYNLLQIEKHLWLFEPKEYDLEESELKDLYYQNNIYYAKQGGYEVTVVSKTNAKSFMTPQTRENYEKVTQVVGLNSSIARNFALVCVLADNGGILIDGYMAITEPIQWIQNLNSDINIRRGKRTPNIHVFGYYDPKASSFNVPHDIDADYEIEKTLRSSPGLRPYFLLAKKKTTFFTQLIDEIVSMVTNPEPIKMDHTIYYGIEEKYSLKYFTNAVHSLLQRKQRELDESKKQGQETQLAVDYYELYYINELAALKKLWAFFEDKRNEAQFQNLARIPKQQLYSYLGPFKYITKITDDHKMNLFITKVKNGKMYPIIRGSFIQLVFYPKSENLSFIIDNPQKSISDPNGTSWDNLPRIIWLFWDNGHENAPLSNQLAVESIKRKAKQSGFQVRLVNNKNVHLYLDNQTLERIENSLKNAKVTVFPQSKSDFVRLALIQAHGGVYLDSSYVAITNFDWLINISRYPSEYIFNRFGKHPKVVMQFHPQYGGILQWQFNSTANTKVQWQLPIQNNFIVAQKGSEFIKQWFQLHLRLYLLQFLQVLNIYRQQCGLDINNQWRIQYLIAQEGAKCVIGRRQKYLKQLGQNEYAGAVDYYKIWQFNNLMGIQKYREKMGIESHMEGLNTFIFQYSIDYVQAIIGSNFHLVKFYGWHNSQLNKFLNNNFNQLDKKTHPRSLLMTYMITKQIQFEYSEGRWRVKLD